MACCCLSQEKNIHYVSPAHGGWGVIRVAALVPECYQLFVAPFACGRHGALGAEVAGIKNRISYLYIDENDIVSGDYEKLIPEAIDELIEFLPVRPKVFFIFVSCLDDLLGTDHRPILAELSKKYEGTEFRLCHMNPINMDSKLTPAVTLQNNMYSLLEKAAEKDRGINFIGNNCPIDEDSEIFRILEKNGFFPRHITQFASFEDFKEMSKSIANFQLVPVSEFACENMYKELDIPAIKAYVSYDLEEISAFYGAIGLILGFTDKDISKEKEEAERHIKEALEIIGDTPIAIDHQAVTKPFSLAATLIKYGFNVKLVMSGKIFDYDKEAYEDLKNNRKEVTLVNSTHYDMVKFPYNTGEYLCIGYECGYLTNSKMVMNLELDEGLFGFKGVSGLMDGMVKAYSEKTNSKSIEDMIKEARLVI